MKASLLLVVCALGCGTMMNTQPAIVTLPPGAAIDGVEGTVAISKKQSHHVELADGRLCVLASKVSLGYVLADLFLTGLIGIAVDAATSDWRTIDATGCPGVLVH